MKLPTWLARLLGTLGAIFLILFYPILAFKFRHRGRPGSTRLFYKGLFSIGWLIILLANLYIYMWYGADRISAIITIFAFLIYVAEGLSVLNIISRLPESTYDKIF